MIEDFEIIKEKSYEYIEVGDGPTIVLLHGLMGGLENFESIIPGLVDSGYKVIGPVLPLFDKPLLKTNINNFKQYLHKFFIHKKNRKSYSTRKFTGWTYSLSICKRLS